MLLVDDDVGSLAAPLAMLHAAGLETDHVNTATARELREALMAGPWDLVLAVLASARLDGTKVLKIVQADAPDTPVVLVADTADEAAAIATMHAGACDWVTVGQPARLVPIVERELRRGASHRGLQARAIQFHGILDLAPDVILTVDADWQIVQFNRRATEVFGYAEDEILGCSVNTLVPERFIGVHYYHMKRFADHGRAQMSMGERRELLARRKDGTEFPADIRISRIDVNGSPWYTAVLRDISNQKIMEEKLVHQANHDELTGLPNRRLLSSHLEQAIKAAQRRGGHCAVLFLDLDRFKRINDTLGHAAGDSLLRQVAKRISNRLRSMDVIARLGGDEFAVLITEIDHPTDLTKIGQEILDQFAEPFVLAEKPLHVRTSIGIAAFPDDGENSKVLLRSADVALYRAKELGGARYDFYNHQIMERAVEEMAIEEDLRVALGDGQFVLFYQPQIDRRGHRLVGVEALIRWEHPTRGLLAPDKFIPVAEESGLIIPLGYWVLRAACLQARLWREAGFAVKVAVNFCPKQFFEADLVEQVTDILVETGASADWIECEITESVLMSDRQTARDALVRLREIGMTISIDDFGTGFSSLGYLTRFPVDVLKIDRSFVSHIAEDPGRRVIADAIIAMAHKLGMKVVGEGVETEEQQRILADEGCDLLQGFLFGRPQPADRLADWLKTAPAADAPSPDDRSPAGALAAPCVYRREP